MENTVNGGEFGDSPRLVNVAVMEYLSLDTL